MRFAVVAVAVGAAVLAAPALAQADGVDACVESADQSQELRDNGKLVEAREKLLQCSASACPPAVAKQCAKWLVDVEQALPSIVVRVRDGAGKDVVDANVWIDEAPRASSVDGRAVVLNPGAHTILVRRQGSPDAEERIVVASGEKHRVVTIEVRADVVSPKEPPKEVSVPPPPPRPSSGHFTFPWYSGVLFGVGVAGFVSVAVLVPLARSQANDLRATCAPTCATSDVDAVQTKITIANVMLGVGIGGVALGVTSLVLANVLRKSEPVAAWVMPIDGGVAAGAAGRL